MQSQPLTTTSQTSYGAAMSSAAGHANKRNRFFLDAEDWKTATTSLADMYGTWNFYVSVVRKDVNSDRFHRWLLIFTIISTITGILTLTSLVLVSKLSKPNCDRHGWCGKVAKHLPYLLWIRWFLASEAIVEDLPQIVFSYLQDTGGSDEFTNEGLINLITSLYNLVQNVIDMVQARHEAVQLGGDDYIIDDFQQDIEDDNANGNPLENIVE